MNKRIVTGVTASLLCAAMLSACGGGSGTPPVSNGKTPQTSMVSVSFTVPGKNSKIALIRRRSSSNVSPSTKGLGINVVAHGGTFPTPFSSPQYATNVGPNVTAFNTTCGAASTTDGSYSCTLLVAAPVGYDDIQFTAWDTSATNPGYGGTFSGNLLAYGVLSNQLIQLNQTNIFNVTMDGVVYSADVQVAPNSLVAGAATGSSTNPTQPVVNVLAKDIDGNVIIGTSPYVDATGTAITFTVTASPVAATAFPTQVGLTQFGCPGSCSNTAAFTIPGQTSNITYNGAPIASSGLALSATTGAPAGPLVNSLLSFTQTPNGTIGLPGTPVVSEFASNGSAGVNSITTGPDGNIWYAEPPNTVIRRTPAGVETAFVTASTPSNLTAGGDGNVWYSTTTTNVGKINPLTGIVTEYGGLSGSSARIIAGPDGAIYGTEFFTGKVFRMSAFGGVTEWIAGAPFSTNATVDLTVASDGNIYIAVNGLTNTNTVAQLPFPLPAPGTTLASSTITGATGNSYNSIVSGADGNVWVLESGVNGAVSLNSKIVSIAPGAPPYTAISEYTVSTARQYQYMVAGPDANFYLSRGGPPPIARVSLSGSVLEFSNGISAAAGISWLSAGPSPVSPYTPNSAVWFAENGANQIGAIQP